MLKKITLLLPTLLVMLLGCESSPATSRQDVVLVSVAPYAYFVQQIAQYQLPIHILIPEDANPHVYEPKPKEVQSIANTRLWVRLGDPADQKVYQVFKERHEKLIITDVTQGIHLLSECEHEGNACHHDGEDLHIWLSPRLAQVQAKTIAQGLIEAFPEKQEVFEKGLAQFLEKLEMLDQEISQLLKTKAGSAILVSHPAFAYFCQDYNLHQLSVEMEGKDPLPQHLTHLLEEARKAHVTAVLLQPQYSNKGAELIAKELSLPTAIVNPYAEDYIANLRLIAELIASP